MFALEIPRLTAHFEWSRIGSKVVKTMRTGRFYIFSSQKFTTLVPQPVDLLLKLPLNATA